MDWKRLSRYRSELMGLACLWVIYHHNCFRWPDELYLLKRLAELGNVSVDVFLLLSGISLYFAWNKKPPLGTYYLRRFVRVLIPYCFLAIPYWVWLELYSHGGMLLRNITMLSLPLNGVITTWYVAAIFVFYLCSPGIFWLMDRKRLFGISVNRHCVTLLLVFGTILGCFALRKLAPEFYKNCEIALTRFAVFVVGCDLGKTVYDSQRSELAKETKKEVVLGSVLMLILYWLLRDTVSLPDIWIRFSFLPTALCLCISGSSLIENLGGFPRIRRFLTYFGERSLEIYLSHVLIRNVFLKYFPEPLLDPWRVLDYAVILVLSVLVSEGSHRLSGKISRRILML